MNATSNKYAACVVTSAGRVQCFLTREGGMRSAPVFLSTSAAFHSPALRAELRGIAERSGLHHDETLFFAAMPASDALFLVPGSLVEVNRGL